MPNTHSWDKTIDFIQAAMLWFLVAVVTICVLVLILFDVLVGTGVMMALTAENLQASVFISLATSGLLIALMMVGFTATNKGKDAVVINIGRGVILLAGLVYLLDIFFDSLTADYLRFNTVVVLKSLPPEQQTLHMLFRVLIGGISTIGEGMAVAIIVGMPVLKDVINRALPDRYSSTKAPPISSTRPVSPSPKPKSKWSVFGHDVRWTPPEE